MKLDLIDFDDMTAEMFKDGLHFNEIGAKIVSERVLKAIGEVEEWFPFSKVVGRMRSQ